MPASATAKEREDFVHRHLAGPEEHRYGSLCEALDRVLNTGAVIQGDITISVAGIDLLYVGLRVILTSIERATIAGSLLPEGEEWQ